MMDIFFTVLYIVAGAFVLFALIMAIRDLIKGDKG